MSDESDLRKMRPVNWGPALNVRSRAQDQTGASDTALGDPLRWGAVVDAPITNAAEQIVESPQIVRVQCADHYSRAWTLVGTLKASTALWAYGNDGDPAPLWLAVLQLQMGVGQNVITHNFNLRAICDADAPYYYDFPLTLVPGPPPPLVRPFVIPGAVIANVVNLRIIHIVVNVAGPTPETIQTAVQLAPFNAGTGL